MGKNNDYYVCVYSDLIPWRGNVGMYKMSPKCLASSFLTISSLVRLTAKKGEGMCR